MRKANRQEHEKISQVLKKRINAERLENGFGFGMILFVLGCIIACLFLEETTTFGTYKPLFISLTILFIGFMLWLTFMIFRRFNIYSKRVQIFFLRAKAPSCYL